MASEPFKFHTCKILHNSYLQHISTLRYFNRSFDPAALSESFRNYPLQLAIDTPELISSPFSRASQVLASTLRTKDLTSEEDFGITVPFY